MCQFLLYLYIYLFVCFLFIYMKYLRTLNWISGWTDKWTLISTVVLTRGLQKRSRKDEEVQMAMFSALWVPWRTSVSLPSRRTRSISPLSLRPPSTSLSVFAVPYHFNFPVFVSPGCAIRTQHFFFSGRWYHSRLDLAPSTSPLVLSPPPTRTSK